MTNAKRVIVGLVVLVGGVMLVGCNEQVQIRTVDSIIPDEVSKKIKERLVKNGAWYGPNGKWDISIIESMLEKNPEIINAGIPLYVWETDDKGNKHAVKKPSYTLLFLAALKGQNEVVEYLISKGADVNMGINHTPMQFSRGTALHAAAGHGHIETVKILIDNGANVNAKDHIGQTPLCRAVESGNYAILELWPAYTGDADNRGMKVTPLRSGLNDDRWYRVVELLISKGAKANNKDRSNFKSTPLHAAVEGGNEKIVELLINEGANVNAKDVFNATPLYRAIGSGGNEEGVEEKIVELLIANGANINSKTTQGESPLFVAVVLSHEGAVKLLLEAGADIKSKDMHGNTPWHEAISYGNKEIIKLFKKHGAVE